MKKKILSLGTLMVGVVASMSGCLTGDQQYYCDMKIHENGSGEVTSKAYVNKAAADKLLAVIDVFGESEETDDSIKDMKVETVDGVEYYTTEDQSTWEGVADAKEAFNKLFGEFAAVEVSTDGIYVVYDKNAKALPAETYFSKELAGVYEIATEKELEEMFNKSFAEISVTFDKKIVKTNGTLSDDGKTVSFHLGYTYSDADYNFVSMYAETTDDSWAVDEEAPTVTGTKAGKLTNKFNLKATDGTKVAGFVYNGGFWDIDRETLGAEFVPEKDGEISIFAIDYLGNKSEALTYNYDGTAPKVKGVSNGKTYKKAVTIKYSDKNGIKSATLNGKSFKSGKKVSKKGSYKVKVVDKAGNVTTLSFKIKK